jgi:hypothetical protein
MDYLYFIRAENGPCKIGRSVNPAQRLSCLRSDCPDPADLLVALPIHGPMEKVWHRAFRKQEYRPNSEWFHWTGELERAMKAAWAGKEWMTELEAPPQFVEIAKADWKLGGPIPGCTTPKEWAKRLWMANLTDYEESVFCKQGADFEEAYEAERERRHACS